MEGHERMQRSERRSLGPARNKKQQQKKKLEKVCPRTEIRTEHRQDLVGQTQHSRVLVGI